VLKQNLRVKTFVGTSANALHIQIWTALIALLLLKYLRLKARFGWSLSNLVALLHMNLFVYRNLWAWVNDPFTAPPLPPSLTNRPWPSRNLESTMGGVSLTRPDSLTVFVHTLGALNPGSCLKRHSSLVRHVVALCTAFHGDAGPSQTSGQLIWTALSETVSH
jgi:hypothetical protein